MSRIYVIGAGLAGMASALMAQYAGQQVTIIAHGIGGLPLSDGTLDLLGWESAQADTKPIQDLRLAFTNFITAHPFHPYAKIGFENTCTGISWLTKHLSFFTAREANEIRENIFLPTALGALHPTAAIPDSMRESALNDGDRILILGLRQLKDFPASLIADNLSRSPFIQLQARSAILDLPIGNTEADSTGTAYARAFDKDSKQLLLKSLKSFLKQEALPGEKILFPAVLGIKPDTFAEIAASLNLRIGEIPLLPPSIPGRRIHEMLFQMCQDARIDIWLNAKAVSFSSENDRITELKILRNGHIKNCKTKAVINAAGGFESGNLQRDSHLHLFESIFHLPLYTHNAPEPDFVAENIFRSGVIVNKMMQATDQRGKVIYRNLYCAGGILGGGLPWEENSGEGISLGSACSAVKALNTHFPPVSPSIKA